MSEKILSDSFVNKYKNKTPNWGFNGLGYIVYKRTYSRIKEDGTNEEWHETVARCINGAQAIGANYTKEEAERLYDLVFNLKCNFAGRMLWQLGAPTVKRYGGASLLNCFSGDTEIITESGIKQIKDALGECRLMTENGKYVDAEIKDFGKADLYKISLVKGKSKKTIFATANHRWFRRPHRHGDERGNYANIECTTIDLGYQDRLVSTYGQSIKGIDSISDYGITHGIIFGDGSVSNNVGQVRLCGEKNLELLKFFSKSCKIYDYEGDKIVSGLPKYYKSKPSLDMDKAYLYGWLAGYFAADGSVKEEGQIRLASARKENLDFVRDICVKLGISYSPITVQMREGFGDEESALYTICLNGSDLTEDFFLISAHRERFLNHGYQPRRDWEVASVEKTNRHETVYCAVVPETHNFVLESNILTGNCWFVSMNDMEDFCFVFENLMLGGGVGFSVQRADIHELPKIKSSVNIGHANTKDADFIVPDSREGWVSLLRNIVTSFFVTGKSFTFSTILVRGAGEKISGFGGTASGPSILVEGMEKIIRVFQMREGKKLRSIDVLDINNIIGSIVVAGNVRRSAQIAIGDPDDHLYVRAKNWNDGNIPNWRSMSNNSIYADSYDQISRDIWETGYEKDPTTGLAKGEPYGFINIPLAQQMGRLIDGPMKDSKLYPTSRDNCQGVNPCAEITLGDGEACNLCEIYLNNIESQEELTECAKLLYKTQKAIWTLPFHYEKTKAIVKKNMRIGLGVTGVCQSMDKLEWLDKTYKDLRKFDKEWSKERGWPESIKLTTVKPSGCSRKDSLVLTSDGLMRLDEIGNIHGTKWQKIDRLNTHTSDTISKFYINGKVKTRILRTEDGFEYESSLNHRYWIDGAWKYVKDIKIGDAMTALLGGYHKIEEPRLCTIEQQKITNSILIKQPSHMTPDLAFFVGLFYADGSVHEKGIRISFNRKDNDVVCLLRKIIQDSFGLEGHIDDAGGFYINSVFLKEWLETQGILKNYCHELILPRIIRQSSFDSIRAFITGFWRGDGGQHNLSNWSLCSVSKKFVSDLATMMRAVGYNVSIKSAGPGGYGKLDRWIILNRESKPLRYHAVDFKSRFIGENQWSDKIIEIIESECDTYDIEVENSHQYILNGAISHNTLSLLAGATPGGHPAYSPFFIRRIRMSSSDVLVLYCRALGYNIEYVKNFDGTENRDTVVVEFPCATGKEAIVSKNMSAVQQLELVKKLQSIWADNAVSVTIYYRENELSAIKEWMEKNYETGIKSVSFLLHSDHGFQQAPYEEITEDKYNELIKKVKPVTTLKNNASGAILDVECEGGACPVR